MNVPPESLIGRTLGQYRIVEQLGAGGMGVVYRARDLQLERDVAVKLLPAGLLADDMARKRFRREALALSKLNHANIATVYAFGNEAGTDYLAMELIPGTALSDKLAGGALTEKEALQIGAQITAALEEAHAQGVNHRDLKPGNIVVTPRGVAKVLDFGLAQFFRPEGASVAEGTAGGVATESISLTRGLAGTPAYMSPEQLRGEGADARTDIYALGCVLYEMATGQPVFHEEQPTRLIEAILHRPPVAPRARNERVSPELERIILKCLEKEPERRYQSAKEVGVDLRRLAEPSSVAAREDHAGRKRRAWGRPALAAVVLVLLVLLGVFWLRFPGARFPRFGRPASARIESLAVLPLTNFSGDPAQEYFADGMTEELITDLAKISALRVISRTSVMRYKGTHNPPLTEIARDLNVDAVVEGSVQRSGDRVRITAQLIEARTDRHLWAESYDRDLRDILALQGEVARAIAGEIRAKLTPDEQRRLSNNRKVDPEVHQLYLRGRFYWNKRNREDIGKGLEYFQEVVHKDPEYALGYVGIADSYLLLGQWGFMAPREAYPQLKEAAEHALRMDESLGEAHAPLAYYLRVYEMDWQGAEREFKRAIELNSSYANAHHWYSHFLVDFRRFDESLRESRLALALDPMDTTLNTHLGWHYMEAGQYAEAIRQLQSTLELFPRFGQAHFYLGQTYERQHLTGQAIAEFENATKLPGNQDQAMMTLACVYAESGRTDEARKTMRLLQEHAGQHFIPQFYYAQIYAAMGEKENAFAWLEKSFDDRSFSPGDLKFEPAFAGLRSDARFHELLRRARMPE
ncbi:MAG TPA: protein kinase [Candidatus Acidoferrales bacterium]|nr:protein kinase [Candidatus Acidoferrales bacterium]